MSSSKQKPRPPSHQKNGKPRTSNSAHSYSKPTKPVQNVRRASDHPMYSKLIGQKGSDKFALVQNKVSNASEDNRHSSNPNFISFGPNEDGIAQGTISKKQTIGSKIDQGSDSTLGYDSKKLLENQNQDSQLSQNFSTMPPTTNNNQRVNGEITQVSPYKIDLETKIDSRYQSPDIDRIKIENHLDTNASAGVAQNQQQQNNSNLGISSANNDPTAYYNPASPSDIMQQQQLNANNNTNNNNAKAPKKGSVALSNTSQTNSDINNTSQQVLNVIGATKVQTEQEPSIPHYSTTNNDQSYTKLSVSQKSQDGAAFRENIAAANNPQLSNSKKILNERDMEYFRSGPKENLKIHEVRNQNLREQHMINHEMAQRPTVLHDNRAEKVYKNKNKVEKTSVRGSERSNSKLQLSNNQGINNATPNGSNIPFIVTDQQLQQKYNEIKVYADEQGSTSNNSQSRVRSAEQVPLKNFDSTSPNTIQMLYDIYITNNQQHQQNFSSPKNDYLYKTQQDFRKTQTDHKRAKSGGGGNVSGAKSQSTRNQYIRQDSGTKRDPSSTKRNASSRKQPVPKLDFQGINGRATSAPKEVSQIQQQKRDVVKSRYMNFLQNPKYVPKKSLPESYIKERQVLQANIKSNYPRIQQPNLSNKSRVLGYRMNMTHSGEASFDASFTKTSPQVSNLLKPISRGQQNVAPTLKQYNMNSSLLNNSRKNLKTPSPSKKVTSKTLIRSIHRINRSFDKSVSQDGGDMSDDGQSSNRSFMSRVKGSELRNLDYSSMSKQRVSSQQPPSPSDSIRLKYNKPRQDNTTSQRTSYRGANGDIQSPHLSQNGSLPRQSTTSNKFKSSVRGSNSSVTSNLMNIKKSVRRSSLVNNSYNYDSKSFTKDQLKDVKGESNLLNSSAEQPKGRHHRVKTYDQRMDNSGQSFHKPNRSPQSSIDSHRYSATISTSKKREIFQFNEVPGPGQYDVNDASLSARSQGSRFGKTNKLDMQNLKLQQEKNKILGN